MKQPSSRPARPTALAAIAGVMLLAAAGCGSSSTSNSTGASVVVNAPPAKATLPPRLTATLRASGAVTLTNANGQPVTALQTGRYTLAINVESTHGDFRMIGPMINRATRPHFSGVVLWGLHLVKGTYRYLNDRSGAHPVTHVIAVD
jgi:hypothetical protein